MNASAPVASAKPKAGAGAEAQRFRQFALGGWGWGVASLGVFFLYAFFELRPALQYYAQAPVFFTTREFFQQHLTYPGGLIDYLGAFLLQLYHVPALGAFAGVLVAGWLWMALRVVLKMAGWENAYAAPLIGAALVFLAQGDYQFPWTQRVLAVALAGSALAVYVSLNVPTGVRIALLLVLGTPVYLAGCSAALLFLGTCALWELLFRKGWLPAVAALLLGGGIPVAAARFWFVISQTDAFGLFLPFVGVPPGTWPVKLLFVWLPVTVAVAWCRRVAVEVLPESHDAEPTRHVKAHGQGSRHGQGSSHGVARPWRGMIRQWLCGPSPAVNAVLLVTICAVLLTALNREARLIAAIGCAAAERDWGKVLEAGARLRGATPTAVCDIDHALACEGALLERMFSYPQKRGVDFWFEVKPGVDLKDLIKASDLLFDIGHINRAERMAAESLELNGHRPATLKRLFLTNVLKGQPQTGIPFLNALEHTMWDGDWATGYRSALAADPQLRNDPDVQRVRPFMVDKDYVGMIPDNVLMQISLRQNATNRLAFQYLLAFYLHDGQLDKVVQNLERARALKLEKLPRHMQEALLVWRKVHPESPLDLQGYTIDAAVIERFNRFNQEAALCNRTTAPSKLLRDFGDSYWYYELNGFSGTACPAPFSDERTF